MLPYEEISGIAPSYSEKIIAKLLTAHDIVFAQEVQFKECVNPLTGLHLRFDFYLPVQNVLIEYDGMHFHQSAEVKKRDKIKTAFAKKNGIKLIRVQGIGNIDLLVRHRSIKPFITQTKQVVKKEPNAHDFSKESKIQDRVKELTELKAESIPRFMKRINDMRKDKSSRNINLEVIKRLWL